MRYSGVLLNSFGQGGKCIGVGYSQISQYFAVDIDTVSLQTRHKSTVSQSVLPCRSVDSRNPQCSEVSFLLSAVAIGVLQCAIHGIAGCAKQFAAPPPIALSLFQNFFSPASRCRTVGYSRHFYLQLTVITNPCQDASRRLMRLWSEA